MVNETLAFELQSLDTYVNEKGKSKELIALALKHGVDERGHQLVWWALQGLKSWLTTCWAAERYEPRSYPTECDFLDALRDVLALFPALSRFIAFNGRELSFVKDIDLYEQEEICGYLHRLSQTPLNYTPRRGIPPRNEDK